MKKDEDIEVEIDMTSTVISTSGGGSHKYEDEYKDIAWDDLTKEQRANITNERLENFDAPKARRLKATWSVELEQDIKSMHGIDADAGVVSLAEEIAKEIDAETIRKLTQ